jgi:hypothetical protein
MYLYSSNCLLRLTSIHGALNMKRLHYTLNSYWR